MADGADILVVGAGSAGCVLAARLSEDPTARVLLVEAGGPATDPAIADPLQWPALAGRAYDYGYRTTPQPHTAGRVHDWPRGRLVGGSSCLNAMAHVRGHPDDFLPWAAAGGADWSYQGLLPGFIRSETRPHGQPGTCGHDGPLPVWLPEDDLSPLTRAFMASGQALGAPWLGDHNNGPLCGAAPNSLTIQAGRRVTAADAYLTPTVRARPNLGVRTGVTVERILFDGPRATGVLTAEGPLSADRVVLAAGTIDSALLLMRSGIGDPAALARAGIACRHALPGVGHNLQDHLLILGNLYAARQPVPPSRLQHSESLMYLDSTDPGRQDTAPDVVIACVVAPVLAPGLTAPAPGAAYTLICGATHPVSRGRITPGGPDAADPPIIDPAYLSAPQDRASMARALALARELGQGAALAPWRASEIFPGDAAPEGFIAHAASTHHHPVGTCCMGGDALAVTDGRLAVHGVQGLNVVDASVIPTLPSGPIHAAVIALAETWCARTRAGWR